MHAEIITNVPWMVKSLPIMLGKAQGKPIKVN